MSKPTTLINLRCILGENPLWNTEDQCIYWEDIDGKQVHRLDPATRAHHVLYDESALENGQKVGGFTFQDNGDLLLFRERDIAALKPDGTVKVLKKFSDDGFVRFNDVMADPDGRVYAGSIGADEASGGLYRIDPDGTIMTLWKGCQISNGMGFSPDLTSFYWTDSTRSAILRFPFDRNHGLDPIEPYTTDGTVKASCLFYTATAEEGTTDGMTVDENGDIWTARWDGNAIVHLTAEGEVAGTIDIPARNVTSLCFGGPDLDQFFITSAQTIEEQDPKHGNPLIDGALYQIAPGVKGPEEFRSHILLD